VIYLIHFDTPLSHARHYIGFVREDDGLDARIAEHRSGQGARLLRACNAAGIGWRVVATFPGDRKAERRMKRWRCIARTCPVCRAEALRRRNELARAARLRKAEVVAC
jgi:predicted GIY-YIG superfamily endonuclease